jgi:hypothetical protein
MIRAIFLSLLITGILAMTASAAEIKEIELGDGSVITGEVVSLINGVYTIRTGSLGTLTIEDSKVRSIRMPGSTSSSRPSGPSSEAGYLRDKMMSDQEVMGMIQSLKDDPQFTKILEDPEIMHAVQSGDTAALMANPKFLQLLNNPTVRDIQQKVAN